MSHAITKRQLREQRRAARQAAEAAEKARAARKRRLLQLGGVAGLAAVVLVVVIAVSGGSSTPSAQPGLFRGIPESNGVLGQADAPVTVTEYLDLQCPICANASRTVLPDVVDNYVRTGKVKLQARTLHFIGADSVRAARVAAGAAQQGALWPFLEAFYAKQGTENSGYVTDDFLRDVAADAGVDGDAALAYADTAAAERPLVKANEDAARLKIDGTPTFTVQRGDGPVKVVSADQLTAELAGQR
ncbi:MAG TPA: thioredoxin domain-containing protein [Solirubrobacteraceae bacterium]|nr:thioredoxin domain-containing protein [Solirubrobacteraceae bacterium]